LQEAARYLETFKAYEKKSATAIKERQDDTYLPKVTGACIIITVLLQRPVSSPPSRHAELLTSIRAINKTDVLTLLSQFGSVAGIMMASMEAIAMCPGFGDKKARRVYEAFHLPLATAAPLLQSSTASDAAILVDAEDSDRDSVVEFEHGPGKDTAGDAVNTST
jgi:hypothetical protein